MKVISIEALNSKMKVLVDEDLCFSLYKSEIKRLKIEVNMEITNEQLVEIYGILFKRGKERALYMLDKAYKTEKEIRDKLKTGFYPEEVIDKIIDWLISYNFVNDSRYASLYVDFKHNNKSKKQIYMDLMKKGISKEIINEALEQIDDSDSLEKIINKRISKYDLNDKKSLYKFYNYLVSKGYDYSKVKDALRKYTDNY